MLLNEKEYYITTLFNLANSLQSRNFDYDVTSVLDNLALELQFLQDVHNEQLYTITRNEDSIKVSGDGYDYEFLFDSRYPNTCILKTGNTERVAYVERFQNYISIIDCGEVVCILPNREENS